MGVLTFREAIEIAAPQDAVWSVLADVHAWPAWNPFVGGFNGELREGARVKVLILPWSAEGTWLGARVARFRPPEALAWRGGVAGLFTGEHGFRVEATGEGSCRVVHEEVFSGILTPLFRGRIRSLEPMYERFNEALKARVELPAPAAGPR